MKPNSLKPSPTWIFDLRSARFTVALGFLLSVFCFLLFLGSASAATRYVWQGSPSPGPPHDTWASAAHEIQTAVDAAAAGEEIVVTNGVYATGGRAVGTNVLVNRVAVDIPLRVTSVNGPQFTIIQGAKAPGGGNGDGAVRCVYLAEGASLSGFTLTNGATRATYDYPTYRESSGGGVWCESLNTVVSNCTLTGNSAEWAGGGTRGGTLNNCTLSGNSAQYGGGAYNGRLDSCTLIGSLAHAGGGAYGCTLDNCSLTCNSAGWGGGACGATLNNCTLTGNSAYAGGGAYYGTLNNCTLTGNSADWVGGGAYHGTLNNCIVYFNRASFGGDNYSGSSLNHCCTTPVPLDGVGNLSNDPQLASASHLSATSSCRGEGSAAYASGTDIDGEAWATPPAIGCDEYHPGAVTGPLSVSIAAPHTNVVPGCELRFTALIEGRPTSSVWNFGDGTVVSNRPFATHAWAAVGDYVVVLRAYNESFPEGRSAMVTVHVVERQVHYVATDSPNPLPPYVSWATAATNIQDAVDAATVGGTVLVTNGTYATGGRAAHGTITNRVAVAKPLALRSVNGPELTVVDGDRSARCMYLASGASLSGFTLTNGIAEHGGGLYCESAKVLVFNCVLTGNLAWQEGGGAFGGTLSNCTLSGNWAESRGGGACRSSLHDCTLSGNWADYGNGGGACECTLHNCTLSGNSAEYYSLDERGGGYGGGAYECTLYNCTLASNSCWGAFYPQQNWTFSTGGGACRCLLYNCTLTGNSAVGNGGGASESTLSNCNLTGNSAGGGGGADGSTLHRCMLTGNSVVWEGGGAAWSVLDNCTLSGNWASSWSGGAHGSMLNNCTLTGNSTKESGGGAAYSTLNNCIVYSNAAPNGPNYYEAQWSPMLLNYCCTTPMPTNGVGNIDADPLFLDYAGGNLRLQPHSPCINAGNNAYLTNSTDLDGNPRISGLVVDMGAYEFVFTPGMEVARLILWVNDADLGAKNKQPLLATLSAALASFERGNPNSGANQLHAFQNKVRAQVARTDAALAKELIDAAQQIIEEVTNH